MSEIHCRKCGSVSYVRNGFVRGQQRYRCDDCGCNYTMSPRRGKPPAMKAFAVLLYSMGNASFSMIGRLLGVSHVSVYRWVRKEAQSVSEPDVADEAKIVQIDEMWHYVNGKKTNSGCGVPSIRFAGEPWPGFWVDVTIRPAGDCSQKSD